MIRFLLSHVQFRKTEKNTGKQETPPLTLTKTLNKLAIPFGPLHVTNTAFHKSTATLMVNNESVHNQAEKTENKTAAV